MYSKNNKNSFDKQSMMDDKKPYVCTICEKTFSKKCNFQRHNADIHQEKTTEELFICHHCGTKFSRKFNLMRHISNCKKYKAQGGTFKKVKCSLCDYENSRQNVLDHYNNHHGIDTSTECINFKNLEEFSRWKDEIEKTDISKYIKYASKKSRNATRWHYRCHRDGFFKSSGLNIRHCKSMGSNKINGFCPSRLDATINNKNGEVTIKFIKAHVGHQMDLAKIPLTKSDRDTIATKITQNIPFNDILNEIKDNSSSNKTERLRLLTKKDLFNIKQLYNLNNSARDPNECVSVDEWIKNIQKNVCDSVIRFYKGQGQEDSVHQKLHKDDFLLIIMNDAQLETLKQYGTDCVCIDNMHGPNAHNFELTTLLVLDELSQGFPCLFAFSNRSDSIILETVFTVLRQTLGSTLIPQVFMSDIDENCYTAWSDTMGPAEFRLFSSWDVLEAWEKNVNSKVKNNETKSLIHSTLRKLLEELDEDSFEKMLEHFINDSKEDEELKDFSQYFRTNYYSNRKSWAYCYRQHAGLNTDVHLEKMHRILKNIYLKGRGVKGLEKAINAIMKLVRDKLCKEHKGKTSAKSSGPRKRRKNMEEIEDALIVEEQEDNWVIVSSSEDSSIVYCEPEQPTETASLRESNDVSLDNFKNEILQKFESILQKATTIEKCEIIKKALESLESTLLAMDSNSFSVTCSDENNRKFKTVRKPQVISTKKKIATKSKKLI